MEDHSMSWQYDHIHFKCSDPEKTVTFFKENFGAREVSRWKSGTMPIATLEIGGLWYNFSPRREEETVNPSPGSCYGVYHIALKTKNLEAEAATLRARGVKFTVDVKQANPTTKMAFVEGPDGISIELLQRD
jgi:catechol 2,3-dioxygenase-like lactoylglutathione lyase family enzyme